MYGVVNAIITRAELSSRIDKRASRVVNANAATAAYTVIAYPNKSRVARVIDYGQAYVQSRQYHHHRPSQSHGSELFHHGFKACG